MVQVGRRTYLGVKVSPILDRVALPVKKQVHNLGMLLGLRVVLYMQVEAVTKNVFYQL